MVRWLIPLALVACTPTQASVVRTLGYGLTIEGGAVFAVTYAAQSPNDSIGDAAAVAAPLIVAGIVAIALGRTLPQRAESSPLRSASH
jgi:hypothetical protein